MQYLLLYTSATNFYWKNKYGKVVNEDVHGTPLGPSYGTSQGPDDGTFWERPRDVGHTCFFKFNTEIYLTYFDRLLKTL